MSSPEAQLPPPQDDSPMDEDLGPDQFKQGSSTQNEDLKYEIAWPAQVETGKDQFNALVRSLQKPADRKCIHMIYTDGVFRVLHYLPTPPDQPTDYEIYDARPMSPEMIKAY